MEHVNRGQRAADAVTGAKKMSEDLDCVLARMGEKNETLEEAVEAVMGFRDEKLIAYAQGKAVR